MNLPPFSVLMSVYRNDNPEHFRQAILSLTKDQTIKPDEVVIIVDGPVSAALDSVIQNAADNDTTIRIHRLPQNRGLGIALQIGLLLTSNELVARMDSDDLAVPYRFERQIDFLNTNRDVDICGGQIDEFIDERTNIVGTRNVPCSNIELKTYLKSRCPFNHMTVAFRKSTVLNAGSYVDWHYNEDYYLWIRMSEAGYKFANLPYTLVNVRVGKDMYARRGGWKYFRSEAKLQRYMLSHNIISLPRYCYNVLGRFAVQVAMPNQLRGFIFQKLFRK